jgi:hypothetical protein
MEINELNEILSHKGARNPARPWTPQEDEILLYYLQNIDQYTHEKSQQWKIISLFLQRSGYVRTGSQCCQRWTRVLDPDLKRKQPWSKVEDELLISTVTQHGEKNWRVVKDLLGRSDIICRYRWFKLKQERQLILATKKRLSTTIPSHNIFREDNLQEELDYTNDLPEDYGEDCEEKYEKHQDKKYRVHREKEDAKEEEKNEDDEKEEFNDRKNQLKNFYNELEKELGKNGLLNDDIGNNPHKNYEKRRQPHVLSFQYMLNRN